MILPRCTITEPIGIPPSRRPSCASSIAACRNGSEALFPVLTERSLQRADDLTDGALVSHGVDDERHEVLLRSSCFIERGERAPPIARPLRSKLLQPRHLIALDGLVDREDRQGALLVFREFVHADDDAPF